MVKRDRVIIMLNMSERENKDVSYRREQVNEEEVIEIKRGLSAWE